MLTPDRCCIIGEVALAHDGSLGLAHAFVDAIAATGADAVKFQTHLAEAESTPDEPWRVRFSPQDETRYEYWKRTSFTETQWGGLAEHARRVGLRFLSSPFSNEAVDLLERVGVDAWKVASGEIGNLPLLERIARTRRLVILSSGMSPMGELDAAVACCRAAGAPFAVMQCTTAYPCPPEQIGLNLLDEFRRRYDCLVGLSDHSGTVFPGLTAVALGAKAVEVHVTLSRQMFGPDVPASITPNELEQLVTGARFIERMLSHPVDKDAFADEAQSLRRIFTRSVVARRDLAARTRITAGDLAMKKPGTGIPPARLGEVVGRRLRRDIRRDEQLRDEDLDPAEASTAGER